VGDVLIAGGSFGANVGGGCVGEGGGAGWLADNTEVSGARAGAVEVCVPRVVGTGCPAVAEAAAAFAEATAAFAEFMMSTSSELSALSLTSSVVTPAKSWSVSASGASTPGAGSRATVFIGSAGSGGPVSAGFAFAAFFVLFRCHIAYIYMISGTNKYEQAATRHRHIGEVATNIV
jgi:hypothetical protein